MIKISASAGKIHPAIQPQYDVARPVSAQSRFSMYKRSVKRAIKYLQGNRHVRYNDHRVIHRHTDHDVPTTVTRKIIKIEPPDQGYLPTHARDNEESYLDEFYQQCSTQNITGGEALSM